MAKKKEEIVYIVHKTRLGKPMPMSKATHEKNMANLKAPGYKRNWRLANDEELERYFGLVPAKKEEKPKAETKKQTDNKPTEEKQG